MKIKRAFIPLAFAGFTIPFIISDLTTLTSVGLCYFWSSYIILWNFPQINASLYSKPLYLDDLDRSPYKKYYLRIMNLCLAILLGLFADYALLKGILKDKTLIEISAIIGGNLSLLGTIQTEVGNVMLTICHSCKTKSERKRKLSQDFDSKNDLQLIINK